MDGWMDGVAMLVADKTTCSFPQCLCSHTHLNSFTRQRIQKLTTPCPDLKMRGKLGGSLSPYAVNDCDAKLKGDGNIATITEKETHF